MPPKAKDSEGGLGWWDASWASRTVEFTISVVATFHPSVDAASIRTSWIDNGGHPSPTPTLLGPLNTFEVDQAKASSSRRWPGAVTASMEKPLGSMNVTADLVQGLLSCVLPVHVQLGGVDPEAKAGGVGRIHLGPLLLANDGVEGGLPPRPCEVLATGTETIGLAGLHRLEVKVSTNIPLLSREMLDCMMPICFTVDTLRGLPNESWLASSCEGVHVVVYPDTRTSNTRQIADQCHRSRSSSRPHNTIVKIAEPIVWLLGGLSPHAVREWLQSEEVVVEVHDRDHIKEEVQLDDDMDEQTREAAERKKQFHEGILHPHGIARFKLAPLLGSKSLAVGLRSDVFPSRGNKKRLHAQSGHLASRAERMEVAPDYLASGCLCTIRASLAVPIPDARQLQGNAERKEHDELCAAEHRDGDSNIYVVSSPSKSDKPDGEETSGPVGAPKSRCRAKITAHGEQISGPWRVSKEEAEADEQHLLSVANEGGDVETMQQAVTFLKGKPSVGMDHRYERYGRAVLVLDDKETKPIKTVLKAFREQNAVALHMEPDSADLATRTFHEEELANPHLDVLTGFCVLDGNSRVVVAEGLRDGAMKELLESLDRNRPNSDAYKLLYNPNIGFSERLYGEFGPRLRQMKLKMPLEQLASKPDQYVVSGAVSEDTRIGMTMPSSLLAIKKAERFLPLRQSAAFPQTSHLQQLEALYCEPASAALLAGEPSPEKNKKSSVIRPKQSLGNASFSFAVATFEDEAEKNGRTTLPAKTLDFSASKSTARDYAASLWTQGVKKITTQVLNDLPIAMPDLPPARAALDTQNQAFEGTLKLRKTSSAPDFHHFDRTNKDAVKKRSDVNVQRNVELKRRQPRQTPFLEGKEVYMYSGQKYNCAELQKEWMRENMLKQEEQFSFTYDETHLSNTFELSAEGAESGLRRHQARCPTDTYARLPGDARAVWRNPPPRPKEEFRKPAQDIGHARGDELHEAFVEGEWHKLPIGDERHKPTKVQVRYEPEKIPHERRITERPFDRARVTVKGQDFGPKSMFESVHYNAHGAPGNDRMADVEGHNSLLCSIEESKIIGNKMMRTFSQGNTRKGITCTDREEKLLKDEPTKVLRGSGLDDSLPTSIRIFEPYHASGNPSLEFQARLRENDNSPPFDVNTGGYIKRDPDVGMKKAAMSGTLGKAPWQHGVNDRTQPRPVHFKYASSKDFTTPLMPERPVHNESHVWKNATRKSMAQSEKSLLPYRRPADYGVRIPA